MTVDQLIKRLEKVKTKDAKVVILTDYRNAHTPYRFPSRVVVEHDMETDEVDVVIETDEG